MEGYRELIRTDLGDEEGNRLSVILSTNGKSWMRHVEYAPVGGQAARGCVSHCSTEELIQQLYRDTVAEAKSLGWGDRMKKPSVWLVEDGDYSDYHVVGIYTTKAKATFIAKRVGGEVREESLDSGYDKLRRGWTLWLVLMLRDGTTEECRKAPDNGYSLSSTARIWRRTKASDYLNTGKPDVLQADVWAKDATHAIKIANEFRTRMIATGEWK